MRLVEQPLHHDDVKGPGAVENGRVHCSPRSGSCVFRWQLLDVLLCMDKLSDRIPSGVTTEMIGLTLPFPGSCTATTFRCKSMNKCSREYPAHGYSTEFDPTLARDHLLSPSYRNFQVLVEVAGITQVSPLKDKRNGHVQSHDGPSFVTDKDFGALGSHPSDLLIMVDSQIGRFHKEPRVQDSSLVQH